MKFTKAELFGLTLKNGGNFTVKNTAAAYKFCKKVTLSHYENFPVASALLPGKLKKHIFPVYAFARIADDIADELYDIAEDERISALTAMNDLLVTRIYSGNPVFVALSTTIAELKLPVIPFQKLLIAFKKDICFSQPGTFAELEEYCSYSANPVGEIILRISCIYDKSVSAYSDMICTGLQLVNFWQDLSIDIGKGRIYIPSEILNKYEIQSKDLQERKISHNLNYCLNELYDYTEKFLEEGKLLISYLPFYRLRAEISATVRGGLKMLDSIRSLGGKILVQRPIISRNEMFKILIKSFVKP